MSRPTRFVVPEGEYLMTWAQCLNQLPVDGTWEVTRELTRSGNGERLWVTLTPDCRRNHGDIRFGTAYIARLRSVEVTVQSSDLRRVVEYVEEVHAADDPVCEAATRLAAALGESS